MIACERKPSRAHYYGRLISFVAVAGCGSATDSGGPSEREGAVRDEIIKGSPSNNASSLGVVQITSPMGSCTGELLQNDLVLTAQHCVTTDGTTNGPVDTNGADFNVIMDGQSLKAGEVMTPAIDVALLILPRFFQTNGQTWGWHARIYSGTNASLKGAPVDCEGYGRNTYSGGSGTLRSAALTIGWTSPSLLRTYPNSAGQIAWKGDSGGTCFYGPYITGVASLCHTLRTIVESCDYIGPENLRPWVLNRLGWMASASIQLTTAVSVLGDFSVITDADADATPGAIVTTTPNWNPFGSSGKYLLHNFGVWYTGSEWAIFDQDGQPMPIGAAFNVSVGGLSTVETGTIGTTINNQVRLTTANYSDPHQILIITPNFNPPGSSGVFNDHPTGIWYDGTEWSVFNEDGAAMSVGASFNVRIADANDGAFVHTATPYNISNDTTFIDDPNLNGQPGARVFVTQNYNPGGIGGVADPHTVGVYYTSTQWAIFNEDGAPMPPQASFNVMVRP